MEDGGLQSKEEGIESQRVSSGHPHSSKARKQDLKIAKVWEEEIYIESRCHEDYGYSQNEKSTPSKGPKHAPLDDLA